MSECEVPPWNVKKCEVIAIDRDNNTCNPGSIAAQ